MLDRVEHEKRHYTLVRHGKAVAHLGPISKRSRLWVRAKLVPADQ
jgi:hypothetical protein